MGHTARTHLLAAALAVGCYILCGCVLAELHLTASPVPPWIDLKVTGYNDTPRTIITATTQTEPTTQPSP